MDRIDGQEYWLAEEIDEQDALDLAGLHLLPGFDEYLLGYRDRSAVLAAEHAYKVVPGGNGVFFPMVVVDGQVVGTWRRTVKKGALTIALNSFTSTGASLQERAGEAAKRYSHFLGLSLSTLDVNEGNET